MNRLRNIALSLLALCLMGAQNNKTVNDVAIASVKTVTNVAIASVKTISGVDNTSSAYTGDLLTETFNTATGAGPGGLGYDTAHTETLNPDENYTGITPKVAGEMLHMDTTAIATQTAAHTVFADRDEAYGAVLLYIDQYSSGDAEITRFMLNGAQSSGTEIRVDADGDLRFLHNSVTVQPSAKIPVDTWVAIYWHYIRDTDGGAASGVASIEWSSDFAIHGSGTGFASTSVGTSTAQFDAANLTAQSSGATGGIINFDDYYISTTAIPSNPWGATP